MPIIKSAPLLSLRRRMFGIIDKVSFLGPLLARITVGVIFAASGWGKLHNLEKVTEFFASLKIPMPGANAAFIGSLEFIGGLLLIIGFLSRLMSVPLLATMGVAIITAKREDISGVADLLRLSEWSYLVFFAWLAVAGPGRASLDHYLAPRMFGDDDSK
jgi:putative oxidoreductase